MIADLAKWLRFYDRGVITRYELAFRLVAYTTQCPTAEIIARVPDEVFELIRSQAGTPPAIEWLMIADHCARDIEGWRAARHEEEKRWQHGLAYWRDYFAFNAEQN